MDPQQRLEQDVLPWMGRLALFLPDLPAVSTREGYAGNGVLGARAGPDIGFEHVVHELAHGFELLESGRPEAFLRRGWGLTIKTRVVIGGENYEHPVTTQASDREARASGIQLRLLQAVDHPAAKGFVRNQSEMLAKHMPDWILGGKTEEERVQHRARVIRQAHTQWSLERVQGCWPQVRALFEQAYIAHPPAEPVVRRSRPSR